ncbi:CLIP-domain serine protease subfamily C [Anopheles darlingi]|uniref:CLIP-domain serine protease subfamily C n=1 Tax=Anopheles darlingi TaxID=43151 RepID=W5JRY9_ANODA|nr:CLIP-domain serine protease subfamily C [Anopheles darlingi]
MRSVVACVAPTLTLLVVLLAPQTVRSDQEVGEQCVVQRTNGPGICRLVSDCPSVIDDIRNRRGNPTKCGFLERVQIVCCPVDARTTTTASSTTSAGLTGAHQRIAEKCAEYGQAVYSKEYVNSLTADEPKLQTIDKCGHTAVELIVDGELAKAREFPHMALIGYGAAPDYQYLCGGSLVSERFILTAGHCLVSSTYGQTTTVRLGELSLDSKTDEAFPEDYDVSERIPHPEYKQSSHYNDIALIKLSRKVIFTPYIRPICLPLQANGPQKRAIASGWGAIGFGQEKSSSLLKVTLDLFSHDECKDLFEETRKLRTGVNATTQMCAGSRNSTKDTCQGDSGGPLQVYNDANVYCTYTVIGVTSFGQNCGLAGVPAIYTRVFSYLSWIENLIFT